MPNITNNNKLHKLYPNLQSIEGPAPWKLDFAVEVSPHCSKAELVPRGFIKTMEDDSQLLTGLGRQED
jgi:hypothetical protein